MAKLAVAALVLVALLAVAQASFRTIVTTTVEEEANQGSRGESQQRCRQQIQQQYQQLQSCRRYLQQGGPFAIDMYVNQGQQQQQLRQCCQPLRNLGPECSCEALNEIVRETFQQLGPGQGGQGGQQGQQQQLQQILQKARNIPRECNIGRECRIETPYY